MHFANFLQKMYIFEKNTVTIGYFFEFFSRESRRSRESRGSRKSRRSRGSRKKHNLNNFAPITFCSHKHAKTAIL